MKKKIEDWLDEYDAKVKAEAIEDFARWLEEHDYLNKTELDYDYEEESHETIIGLSAEEVVNEYKEEDNGTNKTTIEAEAYRKGYEHGWADFNQKYMKEFADKNMLIRREYARGKYMAYLKVMNYLNNVLFMMVDDAPGCHECISELAERIDSMRAESLKELEEVRNER